MRAIIRKIINTKNENFEEKTVADRTLESDKQALNLPTGNPPFRVNITPTSWQFEGVDRIFFRWALGFLFFMGSPCQNWLLIYGDFIVT